MPRYTHNAIALAIITHLSAAAFAQDYTLTIETPNGCPGRLSFSWGGAVPNSWQGIVIGEQPGMRIIPRGHPCAGTYLGLSGRVYYFDPPGLFSTRDGSGTRYSNVSAGGWHCGKYLQLIEVSTCEKSNIAMIRF
jgi:hypothetical protein